MGDRKRYATSGRAPTIVVAPQSRRRLKTRARPCRPCPELILTRLAVLCKHAKKRSSGPAPAPTCLLRPRCRRKSTAATVGAVANEVERLALSRHRPPRGRLDLLRLRLLLLLLPVAGTLRATSPLCRWKSRRSLVCRRRAQSLPCSRFCASLSTLNRPRHSQLVTCNAS